MNPAIYVTLFRVFAVPVFIGCLLYYSPARTGFLHVATLVFAVACVSDAIDGYLARSRNQITVLGSYIDPLADKLLLVSGFLAMSFMPNLPEAVRIPAWVTIPVIARDVLILVGSAVIFITTGVLKAQPLFVGKITTVFQMAALFASLVSLGEAFRSVLNLATVFLTLVSCMGYVRLGGRMLK